MFLGATYGGTSVRLHGSLSGGPSTASSYAVTPNTGAIAWASGTRLLNAGNGIVRITNSGDTSPTSLASGIQIGSPTVGASLVYDSVNGLRAMNVDRTANAGMAAAAFRLTNADGSTNIGTLNDGLAVNGTAHSVVITSNGTVAATFDINQRAAFSKAVTVGSEAGTPAGANGMLVYDSNANALKAFVNGLWRTVTVSP